jgi:hypothetical protein
MGRLIAVCLLLSSLEAGVVFAEGEAAPAAAAQPDVDGGVKLPVGKPMQPVGMDAIPVKAGTTPPFTKDDVVAFFAKNNLPTNLGRPDEFQVASLEFLSNRELTERLDGISTGRADEELVGFVTLEGKFIFASFSGNTASFERAYAVFDGATGNLLMLGTLD